MSLLRSFSEILIDSCIKFHCLIKNYLFVHAQVFRSFWRLKVVALLACNLKGQFWTLFNFAILQELGKLPNLVRKLHSSLIGFDKTRKLSFRKQPERSSIPKALRMFVLLKRLFYVDFRSMCQMKTIGKNGMYIILYYRVKCILLERVGSFLKRLSAKVEQ